MKANKNESAGVTTPPKVKNPIVLKVLAKECGISLVEMKAVTGAYGNKITECLNYGPIPQFPSDFRPILEVHLRQDPKVVNWLTSKSLHIEDIWMPVSESLLTGGKSMQQSAEGPLAIKILAEFLGLTFADFQLYTGAPLEAITEYIEQGLYDPRLDGFCDKVKSKIGDNSLVVEWLISRGLGFADLWKPASDELKAGGSAGDHAEILSRMQFVTGSENDVQLARFLMVDPSVTAQA